MTKRFLSLTAWCALSLFAGTALLSAEDRQTPLTRAASRAIPSVGNIHTEKSANPRDNVFSSDKGRKINGMGTGVVVDERGYMLTNYHVVADVDTIRVEFADKSSYLARKINADKANDLALIKIDATKPLKVIPHGTSSDLMVCETVIAIGNPFGYEGTATVGYVSALGRDVEANETQFYKNLIQTDAAINPGNSGGPLINVAGEVIGINVAIRAGANKIGFAIPIDDVRVILERLISIEQLDRTYHGMIPRNVKTSSNRMLMVEGAQPDSPAATAGLKNGDIILKAGDTDVVDGADWERALLGRPVGDKVEVTLRRSDKVEKATLVLANYTGGRTNLNQDTVASRPTLNTTPVANADDRFWQQLGVKLSVLPESQKNLVGPKYRGGMRVTDVRDGGPSSSNGIQKGDILVGLDKWETMTADNINWILTQPNPLNQDGQVSLKFFVIRGTETRYGFLPVNVSSRVAAGIPAGMN
jgi:serine protease Do